MHVLALNAGSSSLRYQVIDPDRGATLVSGHIERIGEEHAKVTQTAGTAEREEKVDVADHGEALELMHRLLDEAGGVDVAAIGHRVVHGGSRLAASVVVDDAVLAEIERLAVFAPLHNPAAAAGIRSARASWPDVPQVACFDTGFFSGLPAAASTYAIDRELAARHEVRRYGFHGLSHEYVAAAAARFLSRAVEEVDQVVLHLGNGASASAIRAGRPVDTSMGLTPVEGLVMGTRSGDLDPGLLPYLQRQAGLDADGIDELLNERSGIFGLTGHTDFRDLDEALGSGDEVAQAAFDVYVHRLRKYVGAYLAVLGGADAITFTAGVGEHNARVRAAVCSGLEALGVVLSDERNRAPAGEARRISADGSAVAVLVVPTDEELAIARKTAALLG
ncbi:MAG TPA: acetate kinase [Marmoricola sp.]|nr:acetate kinase [Marmoricola sp.]